MSYSGCTNFRRLHQACEYGLKGALHVEYCSRHLQLIGTPMRLRTTNLKVTGTYYYNGVRLYKGGLLRPNQKVMLKPEPENPHDRNAVSVRYNGEKIGHLTREMAAKYQPLIMQGSLTDSVISTCSLNDSGQALDLLIRVTYVEHAGAHDDCPACSGLPNTPGVYEIRFSQVAHYVGSTINLRKRCSEHIRRLRRSIHTNVDLQALFARHGEQNFEFHVVKRAPDSVSAVEMEGRHIQRLLNKGEKLVNKTMDGKGYSRGSNIGEPVHITRDYGPRRQAVKASLKPPSGITPRETRPSGVPEHEPVRQWKRLGIVLGVITLLILLFA